MSAAYDAFIRETRRTHAMQRAEERYGIKMTIEEYDRLSGLLANALDKFWQAIASRSRLNFVGAKLLHLAGRASSWKVDLGGQEAIAVYDHGIHAITTFLPPDAHTKRLS